MNKTVSLTVAVIAVFLVSGVFVAAPSVASGSVTVSLGPTNLCGTTDLYVWGSVSPPPHRVGTNVAVSITNPFGSAVDVNQFQVHPYSGWYLGTFVTGGRLYKVRGTYTVTVNYNGATMSATFTYRARC